MNKHKLSDFARSTSLHAIEGGAIIHDAAGARLFVLNAPGALVWLGLQHGFNDSQLGDDLIATFGLDAETAREWLHHATASFAGIFDAATSAASEPPVHLHAVPADSVGADYRFLGQTVRIDAPIALGPMFDGLFGGAPSPRREGVSPQMAVSITPLGGQEYSVASSAAPTETRRIDEIISHVETLIVTKLVPHAPHMLAFHAALLRFEGKAVLLPGASGAGKSTLSAVLSGRGWQYATDEMALLSRGLSWQGVPFPPCIKSVNYARVEQWLPKLAAMAEHDRFGHRVKYAPVVTTQMDSSVETVVFPQYDASATTRLARIDPQEGLSRLLQVCTFVPFGFGAEDVDRLVIWHQSARYFTLDFADAPRAAQLIENC